MAKKNLTERIFLLMVISSIIITEIILRINETAGFVFYLFLITGVLLAFSKIEHSINSKNLTIILLILPVLRIAELFIRFDFFWKALIFYYFLSFLVVYYSFEFRIKVGYTKKWLSLLPLVIILAVLLGVLGNSLLGFHKSLTFLIILPVLVYSEEVLFRGMIQNLAGNEFSYFFSILISAILYGVFSSTYGFYAFIFFFALAFITGLIYSITRNIFLTLTMSFIVNLILFVIL